MPTSGSAASSSTGGPWLPRWRSSRANSRQRPTSGGEEGPAGPRRAKARRRGGAQPPCGLGQGGPLRHRKSLGQEFDGVLARRVADPAFKLADGARTEARTLGQFLLAEAGGHPVAPEQRAEAWRWTCLHEVRPSAGPQRSDKC